MRIAEAIKLLAAPFSFQESFLHDLAENTAVPGFSMSNDIHRMTVLFLNSINIQEGEGGTEGIERWRARTQITPGLILPVEWLSTALRMLVELEKPFLYTRHGLRSAYEWRLIRHLAGQVCNTMGWPSELQYANFKTLWDELSDGLLEWDGLNKDSAQVP